MKPNDQYSFMQFDAWNRGFHALHAFPCMKPYGSDHGNVWNQIVFRAKSYQPPAILK